MRCSLSDLLPLRAAALGYAVMLCSAVGCGSNDEIKTYQVKKPADNPAAASQAEPTAEGPAKVRLLGAIIPIKDGNWFVKFSGPTEVIDAHEKEFDAFVNSIRVADDPRKPPTYTAPSGWKEQPARQMRLVTFAVDDKPNSPQVYISTPFGGSVLDNVNRWREEVGAKRATAAELPSVTKELLLGTTVAYRVDARGPGGKGGMMRPPFAGQ